MITCPNCGAGNKTGSTACRMCGTSLESAGESHDAPIGKGDRSPSAGSNKDHQSKQEAADSVNQTEIQCPNCQTVNEAGWSFCQQCGNRLQQAKPPQAQPPQSPAQKPPPQRAPVANEPADHEGFTTVPTEVPVEKPSLPQPSPVPNIPPTRQNVMAEQSTGEQKSKGGRQIPAAPPTVVSPPPEPERKAPHASQPDKYESLKTVVAEPPIKPPAKPEQVMDAPPGADEHSALTEAVMTASKGLHCPQCNHLNGPGNAYCANCGAVITVAKTVVMSSPAVQLKGSLHLVMEGGQSGEAYELDEETVIGRAGGDITFPHDGFMSGRHARIVRRGNSFILTDEGSRNGTFIKIKDEVELKPGDMILVGKQLFRFEV
jgi:hypothetical protein